MSAYVVNKATIDAIVTLVFATLKSPVDLNWDARDRKVFQ